MADRVKKPRRLTRLKSERVQGTEPRQTRLKSERVQEVAREGGRVEADRHLDEDEPLREAEFCFSRPATALLFVSVAAAGAALFGLDPRVHCGDSRVRVWFPAGSEPTSLDLNAADGPSALLRGLELVAREMERAVQARTTR
jgi:hypothetical protein